MDAVGHAISARSAARAGWRSTNEYSAASANTSGASWRQVSQSIQVESTKNSPGTFSGTCLRRFAIYLFGRDFGPVDVLQILHVQADHVTHLDELRHHDC